MKKITQKYSLLEMFRNPTLERYFALSRRLRNAAILCALVALSARAFAHLDIHSEVPHGTWERFEREERKEAYEKFQNEPERCTEREQADAYRHEIENTA